MELLIHGVSLKKDTDRVVTKLKLKDFPRLDKKKSTKARKDLIDYDYLKLLTKEELKFLNQFTDEFYCANFAGDTIHPKELQKDCEKRNNDRNNDLLTVKEITGGINYNNYPTQLDDLLEGSRDAALGRDEVLEEIEDAELTLAVLKKLSL
jgi:hypothetical protein